MGGSHRGGSIAALAGAAMALAAAQASAQIPSPDPQASDEAPKARIAFATNFGVRTIAADGSDLRRLTTPAEGRDGEPTWSPDGTTIAFVRYRDVGVGRIWFISADGAAERPLTSSPSGRTFETAPTWAPDGTRIAFLRRHVGRRRRTVTSIVTATPAGGDERPVHTEVTDDNDPLVFLSDLAWSPDGGRILFGRSTFGGREPAFQPSLYVVPAAGGEAQRLKRNADHGVWSPDGTRIAYSSEHDRHGRTCGDRCVATGEIHVMNADGSGARRLTNSRANDRAPSWSGDGERLAFHSDRNSTQAEQEESPPELYSIKHDGTCLTWLTNGTAHSESPSWQPGAGLSSDAGGCGALERAPLIEVSTARVERFNRFPWWWFGRVAPNGLLLTNVFVRRDTVSFGYQDCGRFDPDDCGDFLNVTNIDLCAGGRHLRGAGRRTRALSLVRGALLHVAGNETIGTSNVYTGRTRIELDTASGQAVGKRVIAWLRVLGRETKTAAAFPATRLPRAFWKRMTRVSAVHRRSRDVDVVAKRLRMSRAEVRQLLAAAKRLDALRVQRPLRCSS